MENNTYKTRDLSEAAALIMSQQKLIKTERDGRICWFVFSEKEKSQKLSHQYFFGELYVNARDYHETLDRLKTIIFSTT